MTNKLLLPNRYKLLGWCLLIPATILGFILSISDYETLQLNWKTLALFNDDFQLKSPSIGIIETNLTPTIVGVLFIIGALFVVFTKEKNEDEYIANLRLSSLLWAVLVNYSLLLLCFLFVYGMAFFTVMLYTMFTTLIIFIVRFNYILYKNSKVVLDEK
jgi:hypothetical protein